MVATFDVSYLICLSLLGSMSMANVPHLLASYAKIILKQKMVQHVENNVFVAEMFTFCFQKDVPQC